MIPLLVALLQTPGAAAVDPICERLLAASVVARVAGVPGVHAVPRNPARAAGGACNYALPGDTLLLIFTITRSSRAVQEFQARQSGTIAAMHPQPVPGLGDEAVTYGQFDYALLARKGNVLVSMATFFRTTRRPTRVLGTRLSRDQVIALAREVLTRS
jgi:hypothetical protein